VIIGGDHRRRGTLVPGPRTEGAYVAYETDELVTVTLPAEDWARLRECPGKLSGYAELYADQVVVALAKRAREEPTAPRHTAGQLDLKMYLALAHNAQRLNQLICRRVEARMGKD
jgi:hypothetical protein